MAVSPQCFVCFRWDLQKWKEQFFNLIIGTEGIIQLLKWNFERSNVSDDTNVTLLTKRELFFFEHVLYLLSQILILRWGKGHNSLFARINKKEHIEWLPPLKNYFFTIIQSSGGQLLNFFLKRKKLRLKIFKFLTSS